ncbi:hypothetical protein DL991_22755 [Amycolatopsis sp. WAC 01375]|nr:hypothetical protein DL991_22755 [Amycolatopsis sp. WAC 01375]
MRLNAMISAVGRRCLDHGCQRRHRHTEGPLLRYRTPPPTLRKPLSQPSTLPKWLSQPATFAIPLDKPNRRSRPACLRRHIGHYP